MVTRNFYNAVVHQLVANSLSNLTNFKLNMTKTDGTKPDEYNTVNAFPYTLNNVVYQAPTIDQITGSFSSSIGKTLFIGSGTTPPTIDDYKLENQITTGFSASITGSSSIDAIYSSGQFTITLTIVNTQTENLVISELGYCVYGIFLYDRIVLDTPITIAPGATKTIEYRLKVPSQQ